MVKFNNASDEFNQKKLHYNKVLTEKNELMNKQEKEHNEEIQLLSEQINELKSDLTYEHDTTNKLNTEILKLKDKLAHNDQQITRLNEDVKLKNDLEKRLRKSENDRIHLNDNIINIVDDFELKLKEMNKNIDKLTLEKSNLLNQCMNQGNDIAKLNSNIDSLKREVSK